MIMSLGTYIYLENGRNETSGNSVSLSLFYMKGKELTLQIFRNILHVYKN